MYSQGLAYTSNGDGTCYVSGIGTCTDTDVVIPSVSPDGDRVTGIGDEAFYYCTALTSVTIPEGVTTIGSCAFWACTSLTEIIIPDSVTTIGAKAFSECYSMISVTIPEGVTTIGGWAFSGCTSLTDVYYTGSEAEWQSISIGSYNALLISATIHYNYVPAE